MGVVCSARLSAVEVAGDLRIINQAARLSGAEVSGTNVRGNLSVTGGGSVLFRSAVSVNLGAGPDVLDLGMDASVMFRAWAILDGAGGGNDARVGWANVAGQPRVRRFAIAGL